MISVDFLPKCASQPQSTNFLIEINDPDANDLESCSVLASSGKLCKNKLPMQMDEIVDPSGISKFIPGLTFIFL